MTANTNRAFCLSSSCWRGGGEGSDVGAGFGMGTGLDKRTVRVPGWKYSLHCIRIEKCYMLSAISRKRE